MVAILVIITKDRVMVITTRMDIVMDRAMGMVKDMGMVMGMGMASTSFGPFWWPFSGEVIWEE